MCFHCTFQQLSIFIHTFHAILSNNSARLPKFCIEITKYNFLMFVGNKNIELYPGGYRIVLELLVSSCLWDNKQLQSSNVLFSSSVIALS